MALNTLSLPIDIPWKRLCASEAELDPQMVGDRAFPGRWRSTVVIFSYQPPEEHQTYPDAVVSYLKVTCTITGFQAGPEIHKGAFTPGYGDLTDTDVIEAHELALSKYYGCYGAILEVALKPAHAPEDLPKSSYPYFIDCEPKKRELYELVTETGETLSRSLDEVQVQKGTTTTRGSEVLDSDTKVNWAALGGMAGGVAGASAGPAGMIAGTGLGTAIGNELGGAGGATAVKDINQTERTNLQTTDRSKEMRELYSHSTQLSQMYHQFLSYHLGTDRAVFVMMPRPHVVQSEHTFVTGPRILEGIQEVFLVVVRPKELKGVCVDAYLETAHLSGESRDEIRNYGLSAWDTEDDVGSQSPSHLFSAGSHSSSIDFVFDVYAELGEGFEIDMDRGQGGYDVVQQQIAPDTVQGQKPPYQDAPVQHLIWVDVSLDRKKATVKVKVGAYRAGYVKSGNIYHFWYPSVSLKVKFYLKSDTSTVWLTGRGTGWCCPPKPAEIPVGEVFAEPGLVTDSVIFETPITSAPLASTGVSSRMAISDANRLRAEVGSAMIASVNSPRRYPRGTVSFAEAQFVADRVAGLMDRPGHRDNVLVSEIAGLERRLRQSVAAVMPRLRRAALLRMKLQETKDRFGLSHEDAVHVRRATLGLTISEIDPQDRWDPPARRRSRPVPNLAGLTLDQAQGLLSEADLAIGDVDERDSEQPAGVILRQAPKAGDEVKGGTEVDVVIATGLTVRIPDVVGKPLTEALRMLSDAGLQAEPELNFTPTSEHPRHTVLEVKRPAGTYVTPYANVTLKVATGGDTSDKGRRRRQTPSS